jgi:sulfide:quinone oxidoreductase
MSKAGRAHLLVLGSSFAGLTAARFILTGLKTRNESYPEVFAVVDAAALVVPKLGFLGHRQADVLTHQIALQPGTLKQSAAGKPCCRSILCFGDMGAQRGVHTHSNTWLGALASVLKMGCTPYAMSTAFRGACSRAGGRPIAWSMALSELSMDRLPVKSNQVV